MKKIIFLVLLVMNVSVFAQPATSSGIKFGFTRIVYSEKESKGTTFKATNSSDSPLLIQAWGDHINTETGAVDSNKLRDSVPFIVLPPLQRVEPGEDFTLQLRPNGLPLPEGRESVFLLSFKAIPVEEQKKVNRLAVTIVTSLKVFIRNHLSDENKGIETAIKKVSAGWDTQGVFINNPTPYWLTLSSMKVDNHLIDKAALLKMVAPMQTTYYPYTKKDPHQVTLQFIDEYSMDTPPVSLKIK